MMWENQKQINIWRFTNNSSLRGTLLTEETCNHFLILGSRAPKAIINYFFIQTFWQFLIKGVLIVQDNIRISYLTLYSWGLSNKRNPQGKKATSNDEQEERCLTLVIYTHNKSYTYCSVFLMVIPLSTIKSTSQRQQVSHWPK